MKAGTGTDFAINFNVGNDLDVGGQLDLDGTLDVHGHALFQSDVSMNSNLDVTGNAIFQNDIGIGTSTPQGNLHVSDISNCYFIIQGDSNNKNG